MGQAISSPDLSGFATKTELQSLQTDINELNQTAVKTDELDTTFVNKISDKATYSEASNTDNNTYVTPLYWGERFNANRSSLQESNDNETKYVTPKFINERKNTWTVSAANDPLTNDSSDDKFVTPAWTNAKLNKEKLNWTVSASNNVTLDNVSDDKFATPSWTSAKIDQHKNEWTVSALNDPSLSSTNDLKFATPGWISSKMNQEKINSTISAANDPSVQSTSDDKFATAQWVNKKLDSLIPTSDALDTISDKKFVTPKYLTENRTALNDSHKDSAFHFSTPKYLNEVWLPSKITGKGKDYDPYKLVTGDIVEQKIQESIESNPIVIAEQSEEKIANTLSTNNEFNDRVSRRLQNSSDLQKGVAEGLTTNPRNPNIPTFLAEKVSDRILTYPTLLVSQLASKLARSHKGELTSDLPGYASVDFETRLLRYGDNINNTFADFQTKTENDTNVITSGKFGNSDSQIQLINSKQSNDTYLNAKNSHLEIRGAAKGFSRFGSTANVRGRRRVKIIDDLLVGQKVAIGPNVDTMPDNSQQQEDTFNLKVGGPALFTQGIETQSGTSQLGGNINIVGNTNITGKVGIATDADINYDLKVGGPAQFVNATVGSLFATNITMNNLRVTGPSNFDQIVAFNDNVQFASNKTTTFSGQAIFNGSTSIGNLNATTGTIGNVIFTNLNATNGTIGNARFTNFNSTNGTIANLNATSSTIGSLSTNSLTAGGPASINGVLNLNSGIVEGDENVQGDNKSNTYIRFGSAGSGNDWAYLRQIGGNNAYRLALDLHDDGNEQFTIRQIKSSGSSADTVKEVFNVNADGNVNIPNSTATNLTATNLSTNNVNILPSDPGPMIQKRYGDNGNRYGFSQDPNGTVRVFAANAFNNSTVNLSMATGDTGNDYRDLVTVNKAGDVFVRDGEKAGIQTPNGQLKINRHGIMFGGANDNTRQVDSAQISAGIHEPNSLNIVGMSTGNDINTRKVRVWAEGGMRVDGPLSASSINASSITGGFGQSANCAGMQNSLQPGQVTFGADVDSARSNAFWIAGKNRDGTTWCRRFTPEGKYWVTNT